MEQEHQPSGHTKIFLNSLTYILLHLACEIGHVGEVPVKIRLPKHI